MLSARTGRGLWHLNWHPKAHHADQGFHMGSAAGSRAGAQVSGAVLPSWRAVGQGLC